MSLKHITTKFQKIKTIDIFASGENISITVSKAVDDEIYELVSRVFTPIYNSSKLRDIQYMSTERYTKYIQYLMDQGDIITSVN